MVCCSRGVVFGVGVGRGGEALELGPGCIMTSHCLPCFTHWPDMTVYLIVDCFHVHACQARQALGLGPEAFLPSTLDAQEKTLQELDIFAPTLKHLLKASTQFADDTNSEHRLTAQAASHSSGLSGSLWWNHSVAGIR